MIVLTGATGFLGSHLMAALLNRGDEVIVLKRSFSDTWRIASLLPQVRHLDLDTAGDELEALFRSGHVRTVIHCATDYGRREREPYRIVEANIVLPLHLLYLAQKHDTHCFINTDTILDKRISHYSLSKSQFLQWLEFYSTKLLCINLALEHFYGACDDRTKFTSWVIDALLRGAPSIDLTPGEQTRHFVHIDDVISAFTCLLDHTRSLGNSGLARFEVGALSPVTIRDFILRAQALSGNRRTELRFGALPYRDNEIMHPSVDLTALRNLGWTPRISLEEGLARTIRGERLARSDLP